MQSIYMYYFSVIMPTVEPVAAERDEYNSWLMPLTQSEPALMYALVGCMAYDIHETSATGFGPVKYRDMLSLRTQYKVKAISALNQCLASHERAMLPSTIIAVHFLLWQEVRPNRLTGSKPANGAGRSSQTRTACISTASSDC
jgi:hypothetical protein